MLSAVLASKNIWYTAFFFAYSKYWLKVNDRKKISENIGWDVKDLGKEARDSISSEIGYLKKYC